MTGLVAMVVRRKTFLHETHVCAAAVFHLVLQQQQQQRFFCSNIPGMTRKTREKEYERLVDLEKPYKKVMALKDILLKEPENVFSFSELGKLRTHVGLTGKARFITLISKYPAIFELYKDEANHLWCGFSPQAQILADQEIALRKSYEAMAVQKLRKLLMMSVDRRIRVPKIAQLRRDLGFPPDFHSRMVYAYPQYFRIVDEKFKNEDGPVLELTCWDPSLAVTSLETRARAAHEFNSAGEPLFKMCVSRAIRLSKKQQEGINKFQERPFISPYADSKDFDKNTLEFEKRQVALLHEILSMTLEKKTVFDYLTHFRKEYRFPHSLLAMALRHNCIFYVSRKGGRFTIFLKEAYEGANLVEKNEWNLLKEHYIALMDGRKLKKVEDAGSTVEMTDANTIDDNIVSVEDLPSDQVDADFDALIALCRKIKVVEDVDSVTEAANVADGSSRVSAKTSEGRNTLRTRGISSDEEGTDSAMETTDADSANDSYSRLEDSDIEEAKNEFCRDATDEDEELENEDEEPALECRLITKKKMA